MIIDIGCGNKPIGYVNLDKEFDFNIHIDKGIKMNPKEYFNFIIGDAQELPIKNNCFEIVYSSHLLEHLPIPLKALYEFKRISKEKIIIKIPLSIDDFKSEHEKHLYSWNHSTFRNLLEIVFNDVDIRLNSNIYLCEKRKLYKILMKIPFGLNVFNKVTFKFFINELIGVCYK